MSEREKALALFGGSAADDLGDFIKSPKIIRMKIVQPTSQDGTAGTIAFTNAPDDDAAWSPVKTLTGVIPLKFFKTRVMFGKGFKSAAACGSSNARQPDGRFMNPPASNCNLCVASLWDNSCSSQDLSEKRALEKELGRKQPKNAPVCSEVLNIICVDDRQIPYLMTFHTYSQIKTIQKELIDPLIKASYKGRRPFQVCFDVTLKETKGEDGRWYDPMLSPLRENKNIDHLVEAYHWAKNYGQQAVTNTHAIEDSEKRQLPPSDPNELRDGPDDFGEPPPFDDEVPF